MKIIILGAGELGKYLAATLVHDKHDIVVIDKSDGLLERLREHLDVMTIEGNGATLECLRKADLENTDVFMAVSGDEAANILACQIAKHFNVKYTICRLYSNSIFSEHENFMPKHLSLDRVVVPADECVRKIIDVMDNRVMLEKIMFSEPNAQMNVFEILPSCPLAGVRIKDFPVPALREFIRFAAILRDGKHLIPHGETIFVPGDIVYVAGQKSKVDYFVDWAAPGASSVKRVIIVGETLIGKELAVRLCREGYQVRMIVEDAAAGEKLLEEIGEKIMIIHGGVTEADVMKEAGVDVCDVFVSAIRDEEDCILSCILAKKLGARKVIAVTNSREYIEIVNEMHNIECGFSATVVALNAILQNFKTSRMSVDAILPRLNAYIFEFKIEEKAQVCGKKLKDIKFPLKAVFALIFRDGEVIAPAGDFVFQAGDIVATIADADTAETIDKFFRKRRILA